MSNLAPQSDKPVSCIYMSISHTETLMNLLLLHPARCQAQKEAPKAQPPLSAFCCSASTMKETQARPNIRVSLHSLDWLLDGSFD